MTCTSGNANKRNGEEEEEEEIGGGGMERLQRFGRAQEAYVTFINAYGVSAA